MPLKEKLLKRGVFCSFLLEYQTEVEQDICMYRKAV
jgi:hypothetical protein